MSNWDSVEGEKNSCAALACILSFERSQTSQETSICKISKSHLNNLDKKAQAVNGKNMHFFFPFFSIWQLDLYKTLQEKRLICASGNTRFWLETSQAISQVRSSLLPDLKKEKRTKQHEYCIQLSSSSSSCTLRNALISALSPISTPPETLCFGPPLLLVLCVKQHNHQEVSGGRSAPETWRYGRNRSRLKNSSGTLFSAPTWRQRIKPTEQPKF